MESQTDRTTAAEASSTSGGEALLASPRHTVILLLILAAVTLAGVTLTRGRAPGTGAGVSSRVPLYLSIAVGEWALVYYVWVALKHRSLSLRELIRPRGSTVRAWAIDLLIAGVFWGAARIVLLGVGSALGISTRPQSVQTLLPRTTPEIVTFLFLAVTAGFCEEVVYRGYLQRQFTVLLRNPWLAIVAQALIFGLSHAYQGIRLVAVIFVYGTLFGLLAALAKSLRPGILAHAWQDIFSGVLSMRL